MTKNKKQQTKPTQTKSVTKTEPVSTGKKAPKEKKVQQLVEQKVEKQVEKQCDGCAEYERMLNDEVKRLDELHKDISTQLNSNDVFAMLHKNIDNDIKEAIDSYSKNKKEQVAFGNGINWLMNKLKELTSMIGEKWTDD